MDTETGFIDHKRRREASPTSSDVTSSTTNAARRNSLGSVVSASLLRARANSRSSGAVSPHAEATIPDNTEERNVERTVDSSGDGVSAESEQQPQESGAEEVNLVTESSDSQPFEAGMDEVTGLDDDEVSIPRADCFCTTRNQIGYFRIAMIISWIMTQMKIVEICSLATAISARQ